MNNTWENKEVCPHVCMCNGHGYFKCNYGGDNMLRANSLILKESGSLLNANMIIVTSCMRHVKHGMEHIDQNLEHSFS
jgi:hypothetical protein